MGLYLDVSAERTPESFALVGKAKTYTMYERGGVWYVNFRADSRQFRLSTGKRNITDARALVEAFRAAKPQEQRQISGFYIERMIERARARAKKKRLDFGLNAEVMRGVVERSGGCCEVTGHPLEETGPFRPSLDRIDCAKGYTPDNVRIVCLITNTAMLHYGEAAFMELAIAVCRHRNLIPAD